MCVCVSHKFLYERLFVSHLICMCVVPFFFLPFVPARSMRVPAIQALGNISLLSHGIQGRLGGLGGGLSCR